MRKIYSSLDIMKFVMAFIVVAIHTCLFEECATFYTALHPLYDLAVPEFFIISAFLLFDKIKDMDTKDADIAVMRFVRRLAVFYLFWFIVMLPMTVVRQHYSINSISQFFMDLFLGDTFRGSYFIMCLILGTPILYIVYRYKKAYLGTFIFLFIHLYWSFGGRFELLGGGDFLKSETLDLGYSFIWRSIYIALGMIVAINSEKIRVNNLVLVSLITVAYLLYFLPGCEVFGRLIIALSVFCIIKGISVPPKPIYMYFRKLSIVIYVSHFVYASAYHGVLIQRIPLLDNSILCFVICALMAFLTAVIFEYLSRTKYLGFLKYGL